MPTDRTVETTVEVVAETQRLTRELLATVALLERFTDDLVAATQDQDEDEREDEASG